MYGYFNEAIYLYIYWVSGRFAHLMTTVMVSFVSQRKLKRRLGNKRGYSKITILFMRSLWQLDR